ncbi:hypothetical protein SAMN05444395_11121 [Flavobacterium fryxellicola]|uniref:Lipoprotein n=1 Tax=Flavobacterium fryxellicola TaxID=249352 RepID=A0A167ZKF4_9FLAO|nr:hypothetical protein [Flavobacterium fryxellicola]OAB30542.1 hypothetical protein FBFR_01725 [Flavobacterium fryxellicola]SHN76886.1 hypothetical protein SAMN05444395_11121 [Flavobacterium fryxellicola]
MKKVFLFLAILMCYSISFILQSCSTDSLSSQENLPTGFEKAEPNATKNSKSRVEIPANSANPFDDEGQALYKQGSYPILKISRKGSVTSKVKSSDSNSVASSKVLVILSDSLSEIIANWDVSVEAKLSFSRFINSLLFLSKTEEHYEVLYDFIIHYEASILTSETFSDKDKEVILTNSSVVRYETYEESITPPKNKDPDWTILFREVSSSKKY